MADAPAPASPPAPDPALESAPAPVPEPEPAQAPESTTTSTPAPALEPTTVLAGAPVMAAVAAAVPVPVAAAAAAAVSAAAEEAKTEPTPVRRRRKKDPNAPRRPLSAYNIFFRSVRKELKEQSETDNVSFGSLVQTVSKRWKTLDKEGRKEHEELARADNERYYREMKEYREREEVQNELNGNVSSKRRKVVGVPKRPLSGYNIFFKEEHSRIKAECADLDKTIAEKYPNTTVEIAKRWANLPSKVKTELQAKADRERQSSQAQEIANAEKEGPTRAYPFHQPAVYMNGANPLLAADNHTLQLQFAAARMYAHQQHLQHRQLHPHMHPQYVGQQAAHPVYAHGAQAMEGLQQQHPGSMYEVQQALIALRNQQAMQQQQQQQQQPPPPQPQQPQQPEQPQQRQQRPPTPPPPSAAAATGAHNPHGLQPGQPEQPSVSAASSAVSSTHSGHLGSAGQPSPVEGQDSQSAGGESSLAQPVPSPQPNGTQPNGTEVSSPGQAGQPQSVPPGQSVPPASQLPLGYPQSHPGTPWHPYHPGGHPGMPPHQAAMSPMAFAQSQQQQLQMQMHQRQSRVRDGASQPTDPYQAQPTPTPLHYLHGYSFPHGAAPLQHQQALAAPAGMHGDQPASQVGQSAPDAQAPHTAQAPAFAPQAYHPSPHLGHYTIPQHYQFHQAQHLVAGQYIGAPPVSSEPVRPPEAPVPQTDKPADMPDQANEPEAPLPPAEDGETEDEP